MSIDKPKVSETFGEDETRTPLATLGDVERALARVIRRIDKGTLDHAPGQVMVNALGCLAKIKQDARDSKWLPRVKEMWKEREARSAQPEAH